MTGYRAPGRGLALAWSIAALCACGTTPAPAVPTASADAGANDAASGKAQLQVTVQNRAVTVRWDEDQWLWHCWKLIQVRPERSKPVEFTACTKSEAQTALVFGDLGSPGVDFAVSAAKDFKPGPAQWVLRGGMTAGKVDADVAQGTVLLGGHFGGPCDSPDAKATGLVEWHPQAPAKLTVSVALQTAARSEVAISTPEVWIDEVKASGKPDKGGTIQFSYTCKTPGMYTVEVNNTAGGAILNCGVYVGGALPLVPVEKGGGSGLGTAPTAAQLASLRKKLLDLTNQVRQSVNPPLEPLTGDAKLDEIAQYHSDNMANQGFFGHVDKLGMGPGERAKKFGFQGAIGENIANNPTIEGAHDGLYWSAAHRANMLGKTWGRVGFGIQKAKDGSNLLVTENFSTP
jgi:uncharacterized protein YkwD